MIKSFPRSLSRTAPILTELRSRSCHPRQQLQLQERRRADGVGGVRSSAPGSHVAQRSSKLTARSAFRTSLISLCLVNNHSTTTLPSSSSSYQKRFSSHSTTTTAIMSVKPRVQLFFEEATWTCVYVVDDGNNCAIIDSVLDFDPAAVRTSTKHADSIIAYVKEHKLNVQWILETHVHADHLTGTTSNSIHPERAVALFFFFDCALCPPPPHRLCFTIHLYFYVLTNLFVLLLIISGGLLEKGVP